MHSTLLFTYNLYQCQQRMNLVYFTVLVLTCSMLGAVMLVGVVLPLAYMLVKNQMPLALLHSS